MKSKFIKNAAFFVSICASSMLIAGTLESLLSAERQAKQNGAPKAQLMNIANDIMAEMVKKNFDDSIKNNEPSVISAEGQITSNRVLYDRAQVVENAKQQKVYDDPVDYCENANANPDWCYNYCDRGWGSHETCQNACEGIDNSSQDCSEDALESRCSATPWHPDCRTPETYCDVVNPNHENCQNFCDRYPSSDRCDKDESPEPEVSQEPSQPDDSTIGSLTCGSFDLEPYWTLPGVGVTTCGTQCNRRNSPNASACTDKSLPPEEKQAACDRFVEFDDACKESCGDCFEDDCVKNGGYINQFGECRTTSTTPTPTPTPTSTATASWTPDPEPTPGPSEQQNCEGMGGTWYGPDGYNGHCDMGYSPTPGFCCEP